MASKEELGVTDLEKRLLMEDSTPTDKKITYPSSYGTTSSGQIALPVTDTQQVNSPGQTPTRSKFRKVDLQYVSAIIVILPYPHLSHAY